MGDAGTHPWAQGYPLTTHIPGGPPLPETISVGYLGMDRNLFNHEVRPLLTTIPIGPQGIAFDRLELGAWVDDCVSRYGRPAKRSETWAAKNNRVSKSEAASGGSKRQSKDTENWRPTYLHQRCDNNLDTHRRYKV